MFSNQTVRVQSLEIISKNLEKQNLIIEHEDSSKDLKGQLETYKEEISCIVQEKKMLQISKDTLAEEKNVLQTLVNDSKKKILEYEIRIQQYRIEKDDAVAAFETDGARTAQQVSRVEY